MSQLALDFDSATATFPTAKQLCITDKQNQLRLVYECFRQGGEYTFDDIELYCSIRGRKYRAPSISARIRQLNERLESFHLKINYRYERSGSTNTFYRLESSK